MVTMKTVQGQWIEELKALVQEINKYENGGEAKRAEYQKKLSEHYAKQPTEVKMVNLELALSVLNSMEIASHHNGSLQEQIQNAKTVEEKHNLEVLQAKQQKEVNELKNILIHNQK